MTWTQNAPGGVYKDHDLSQKIRFNALQRTIWSRFVRPEAGFGRGMGQSLTITRILQLPRAFRVNEIDDIPKLTPSISTIGVSVSEWAAKLELTEFEENLTYYNLRNQYQQLLRNNMMLTVDDMIQEAMVLTPVKAVTKTAGVLTITNDGTTSSATSNVTIGHLKLAKDYFVGTLKCPPFPNGRYVLVGLTDFVRGLKNDTLASTWLAFSSPNPLISGSVDLKETGISTGVTPPAEYVGTIENVDIYEVNNTDVLKKGIGTSAVTAEALMFGDDSCVLAQTMAPELRAAELPDSLGRNRLVGWVGQMEAKLIWPDNPGTNARVMHFTSS